MTTEILLEKIENTYRSIDFENRYKKLMAEHNDFNNRLQKIEKKEILAVLKGLGYSFKVFSPGQDFYVENITEKYKFIFSFKCKNAIMENYIYVYRDNQKLPYSNPNLAFTYKHIVGNIIVPVNAQNFKDYKEFEEIIKEILSIYEDFKVEFLRQVE
jgi:phosphoserine phosphatase